MPPGTKGTGKKKSPAKSKNSRGLPSILFCLAVIAVCAALFVYDNPELAGRMTPQRMLERIAAIMDSGGGQLLSETWEAELFFGDEFSDALVVEFRSITSSRSPRKKAAALIEALVQGPREKGTRTIPEGTRLRSVSMHSRGLVKVDFSSSLIDEHPGGSSSERMTVYSIVNTILLNIQDTSRVQIMVDGRPLETIAGHIDCREPFAVNYSIVR